MLKVDEKLVDLPNMDFSSSNIDYSNTTGGRYYELSNHLGNVLSVVSDRRIAQVTDGVIGYYTADIVSATDYYPFGMAMNGRTFSSPSYRYGFNGKEKDPEGMGGDGTTYDYGFRIYNPQIAKFLSVDPLTSSYPWYTPYQFAGNSPIVNVDLDGKEELWYFKKMYEEYTKAALENPDASVLENYISASVKTAQSLLSVTDVDDATVIATSITRGPNEAIHIDNSPADAVDIGFAYAGAFIPVVSGAMVKQVYKGFKRVLDGSLVGVKNADNFFTSRGITNFKEFYAKTKNLSVRERVAEFKNAGKRVAKSNGWEKNKKLSEKYDRDIYGDGNLYSLDTKHGEFEVLNKKGKHQGAIDFEGTKTKVADTSGGHDLDTK